MSKLLKQHLRFWVRLFWSIVFFTVILVAVLIQIGRTVFPVIDDYRDTIESQLSLQLGVELVVGEIEAVWQGLRPRVSLKEVSILSTLGEPVFEVGQIDIELSILKTLLHQSPSFRELSFRQLEATLIQTPSHFWRVKGLPESTALTTPSPEPPAVSGESKKQEFTIDDPLDIFLFGRRVQLSDTSLDFVFLNGLHTTVVIPDIRLENDTSFHRLSASFAVDGDKQGLNLVVEGLGDPRDEATFEAAGFLTLSDFPVEKVFAAVGVDSDILLPRGSGVETHQWQDDGQVDLNLWFNRKAKTGLTWQGDVSIEGVPFIPREGMVWPETLVSNFSGSWHRDEGWHLNMTELDLRWDAFESPELNVQVSGRLQGAEENKSPIQISLPLLNVSEWHDVAQRAGFFPEKLKSVLGGLQPQGLLKNIWIDLLSKKEGYFALRSQVESASVTAWQGVPAIENVNGYLEASAFKGHLVLSSEGGFSLNFPKVYQHPLVFSHAEGDVRWDVDLAESRVGISSGQIAVENDEVSAKGYLNLLLPFKSSEGTEPEMTLSIGVKKGVASLHKLLIPYTVPKKLNEWLDRSIRDGVLTDASFIYHGSLAAENQLSRSIQFGARVQQAELKFDPSWPALVDASGVLLLDDNDFKVTDLNGRMMDTSITDGEVELVSVRAKATKRVTQAVSLKANVHGDSGKALILLQKTPIAHILGDELASWKMQGNVKGSIDLLVPIDGTSDAAKQNIQLQLTDNRLHIPSLQLVFDEVSGPFRYTETDGVSSLGLMAKLWGQAIVADVSSSQKEGDSSVKVKATGHIDVQRLQQWSKRPELGFALGVAPVTADLTVPLSNLKSPITLVATSSLEGVVIDLPPPFNKGIHEFTPFQTKISVQHATDHKPSEFKFALSFADRAEALVVSEGDKLKGIAVTLDDQVPSLKAGQINIVGALGDADVILWADTVVRYEQYVAEQAVADKGLTERVEPSSQGSVAAEATVKNNEDFIPLKLDVQVKRLHVGDVVFNDVSVIADQTPEAYLFNLDASDLSGVCTVFSDQRPMKVDLEYLRLSSDEPAGERVSPGQAEVLKNSIIEVKTEVEGLAAIDVTSLPEMDVTLKSFVNGDTNFGRWSFKLRPISGGVSAHNLTAKVLGLSIQGKGRRGAELIWMQSKGRNETFFSGLVTAKNVGSVMELWDMERALTSDKAQFHTDVQWSGAPDEIALERLFGIIDVELEHGRFIRGASVGENPLVKLIGLLNFDTLSRRFRLDFSDLHPEGLSYDRVAGSFQFHRGMVKAQSPLLVDMPVSNIQFLGDIDVINEKVDAKVVVTLPLAGISTTAVAALTGGVPLAVGVFVASKIFKRQVDQASSVRYRVKGSWEDPSVDLEKVFENNIAK